MIKMAARKVEEKAEELRKTSHYKSEFLANMSHELRTPLNSILILVKLLQNNKQKNLTGKQVEFAQVIFKSGSDLLNLINSILDLNKIEAGKIEIIKEKIYLQQMVKDLKLMFNEVASETKIDFTIETGSFNDSAYIYSNRLRIEQILRNLLSNAFKFTKKGGKVTLLIEKMSNISFLTKASLKEAEQVYSFKVIDTGIGIPEDKLEIIFNKFQQLDSSASRRYGGTGLGLSICLELTHLLGGEIKVESKEHVGSKFTVYLPSLPMKEMDAGKEKDLTAGNLEPAAETKEIPKGIKSDRNEEVIEYDDKDNINPHDKKVLLIEKDPVFVKKFSDFAHEKGYKVIIADKEHTGLEYAHIYYPDIIVTDIHLPEMNGFNLLKKVKEDKVLKRIPVMIIAHEEYKDQALEMGAVAHAEKPVSDTHFENIFNILGQNIKPILSHEEIENILSGKTILLADDDMRNVFSLISSLEPYKMKIILAADGKEALKKLEEEQSIDLILMDIMMPEMNGLEAMRKIRKMIQYKNMPIWAITAKAMKGDRERCIEAGASEYLSKPVDVDYLALLMSSYLS